MPEPLTAAQAGDLVRRRREGRGLTQDQLADSLNIDKSYISKLEGGVYHVARSKYFPRIAEALNLSEDDIRGINPSAVFSLPEDSASTPRRGPPIPPVVGPIDVALEIPNELQKLIDEYADRPGYEALKNRKSLQTLSVHRAYLGKRMARRP